MDVKSTILNGYIAEEVYVHQPFGFESHKNPNFVYKHKSHIAWYEKLNNFLMKNGFTRGKVDTTLLCKSYKNDNLIVQIYVDDIISGSGNATLYPEFSKFMQAEFEMSMMGELKFYLGMQIN